METHLINVPVSLIKNEVQLNEKVEYNWNSSLKLGYFVEWTNYDSNVMKVIYGDEYDYVHRDRCTIMRQVIILDENKTVVKDGT